MASAEGIGMNLTYPKSPDPRVPASVLKEIDDANIPVFMTGILLPHVVCTLFIFARIASRLWVIRKWFLDDTLIFLSWLFSTALCIVYGITATTPSLLAAPSEASLLEDVNPYIMRTYLGLIYYQLCLCLTKFSILAFYLRVFVSRPRERLFAWGTVVFVLMYSVPMLLMSFLQCHPVMGQFFGRPMMCFGFPELLISSASLHSATDAWLIAMVIPCVAKLDLPRRDKIALSVVLSLSIFVIAASMVRLQLSLHRHYLPNSTGVTNTLTFFVMTILECDLALICASAPTLRPLLAKIFPGLMTRLSMDGAQHAFCAEPERELCQSLEQAADAGTACACVVDIAHGADNAQSEDCGVGGGAEESRPASHWRRSGRGDGVVLKEMRLSLGSGVGGGVGFMTEKAPLSPNRMSPMSDLSGDTYTVDRNSGSTKGEKYDGKLTTEIPREKDKKVPPRRPRRPDDPA
ncbi:hypothetical protein CGCA056_v014317 [Colletotrichum aenigma]|uniref:uncharacterized protein n=1 Tax=Colletotrichum aenigma TaxID=1215731 RepID=UPI00187331AB|nr:uncharacterized protein CGCA056_v014317 [Colletotrichum aenigma]KAF5502805.1 hypothetical protein CGCA056_v014317 [Colletotrichum aenigma]